MSKPTQHPEGRPQLFQLSQKIVLYRPEDGSFLLVRNAFPESWFVQHYGLWDLVGGRVDEGERTEDALAREINEEAGNISYDLQGLVGVVPMEYRSGRILTHIYLARWKSGDIVLDREHDETRWVRLSEIEESDEYSEWLKDIFRLVDDRLKEHGYLDDLRRLQAEFDNYRKRQEEGRKELSGYLIEKFLMDILPVMDNFRAATAHVPESEQGSPWVTGIQYIEKQLEKVLEDNGVSVIAVAEEDVFDPNIHEAVEDATTGEGGEAAQEEQRSVVAKVFQNGYRIGDRVVRPAKVAVRS